jgi:hypothetical protein
LNIPCSEPNLCSILWVVSVTAWVRDRQDAIHKSCMEWESGV